MSVFIHVSTQEDHEILLKASEIATKIVIDLDCVVGLENATLFLNECNVIMGKLAQTKQLGLSFKEELRNGASRQCSHGRPAEAVSEKESEGERKRPSIPVLVAWLTRLTHQSASPSVFSLLSR